MIDRNQVLKYALKNAFEYGEAQVKSVAGKVLAEHPEAKKDMKETMKLIGEIVSWVNKMPKTEIEKKLGEYTFAEKKHEEKKLELPEAEQGKVVTRFPPEPNGFPHIGHAKAALLDQEAAKAYGGKFIIRFDDTNPEAENEEYVKAILDSLGWIGVKSDEEVLFASDRLPFLYECAKKLLAQGDAYACSCKPEQVKAGRAEGKQCTCRLQQKPQQNLETFSKMLSGEFDEGDVFIRLAGDMASLNTAMRDPTLLRILKAPHYRQKNKYCVWPSYDFETPIMDSVTGVTHAMRSKEYELRDEVYKEVLQRMGLRIPKVVSFSRLSIQGLPVSKRLLKPLVKEGKVHGWDDPRMPTLVGLKRRGILPEAIKKFVLDFGLGKTESEPTLEALFSENRKLLDPACPRFFFVQDPVEVHVDMKGETMGEAHLKKHPSHDMGERRIPIQMKDGKTVFFISGKDAAALNHEEVFRLKDLFNLKVEKKGDVLDCSFAGKEIREGKKVQWTSGNSIPCTVLECLPLFEGENFNEKSLVEANGLCEPDCNTLKKGERVQFERYGFCILDDERKKTFIKTHG